MLVQCGAAPAATASKLVRALGDAVPETTAGKQDERAPQETAHLLLALVAQQTEEQLRQDAAVRAEQAEGVHKLRIAARRIRSAPHDLPDAARAGGREPAARGAALAGQALGPARDAQVLREHLDAVVDAETPELVLGPVLRRIDAELGAAHRAGIEEARRVLDSERYFRLLDALDELVAVPPLTSRGHVASRELVPRLLAQDDKKLRTAVRDVGRTEDPDSRDLAMHEARKKAKRLRYAAESAIPVFGKRAKSYSKKVKKLQTTLGLHQDSVVARGKLRELGIQANLSGENGFTFGRLHALEEWRADRAERDFYAAWDKLPAKKIRRWIRR